MLDYKFIDINGVVVVHYLQLALNLKNSMNNLWYLTLNSTLSTTKSETKYAQSLRFCMRLEACRQLLLLLLRFHCCTDKWHFVGRVHAYWTIGALLNCLLYFITNEHWNNKSCIHWCEYTYVHECLPSLHIPPLFKYFICR